MRIQHNIMAMNAYRNYNNNTKALSGNLEKLSSGYKINRAGDDAAGLAISEKMRAQITGLDAAQKNVKDGISLVKTAEGAMQEIQDMLNRMDYLATQSANGTYDNEVDRYNLQKEVNQLKDEINRIADSANFNGIKLLDGTQSAAGASSVASNVDVTALTDAKLIGGGSQTAVKGVYELDLSQYKVQTAGATGKTGTVTIKIGGQTVATAKVTSRGNGQSVALTTLTNGSTKTVTIGSTTFSIQVTGTKITLTMKEDPTSEFKDSMAVTVSGSGDGVAATQPGTNGNQGETLGVKVTTAPQVAQTRVWAQGEIDLSKLNIKDGATLEIAGEKYTFKLKDNQSTAATSGNVIDLYKYGGESLSAADLARYASVELSKQANGTFNLTSKNNDGKLQLTEKEVTGATNQSNVDYTKNDLAGLSGKVDGNWKGLVTFKNAASSAASGVSGLTLQIGDTADGFNQMSVEIGDMHTSAIGIEDVDISNQSGAQAAVQKIRDAINTVSSVRGDLGAIQNRLDHTTNNLSVMKENIQDAESTIRDTDVADEMMKYVKNNILVQSAQAMLAQANQVPQGVLQLLG